MPEPSLHDGQRGRIESVELSAVSVLPQRGDVVENGAGPGRWERRWSAVPPRWRKAVATAAVVATVATVAIAAGSQVRGYVLEQQEREEIRLAMSIGVWTSSSTPPGGHVSYFLRVRNAGVLPLEVTSVRASGDRIELSARDAGARDVAPGTLTSIPLSVLLTCAPPGTPGTLTGSMRLQAEVDIRRGDGRVAVERPTLHTELIAGVADTLCSVRPGLRDYELSGPINRDGRT